MPSPGSSRLPLRTDAEKGHKEKALSCVQLERVRVIVAVGLMAGIVLSWPLWYTSGRLFPVLPLHDLIRLAPSVELLLVAALFVALSVSIVAQRFSHWASSVAVVALLLFAAADQMRWQPWVYQYGLSLLPFLWTSKTEAANRANRAVNLGVQRAVLIATYFWSGAHKFGKAFPQVWTTSVAEPVLEHLDGNLHAFVASLAYTVAPMEIAIAFALLFKKTRRPGVLFACLTHAVILVLVGPLLGDRNVVIWPWNICMMLLVVVLFWNGKAEAEKKEPKFGKRWAVASRGSKITFALVVFLVGLMPIFSLNRSWDRYLSFHLYSGTQHRCLWEMSKEGRAKLPDAYSRYLVASSSSDYWAIDASSWAFEELRVPFISEDRVILAWYRAIIGLGFGDNDGIFYRDMPYYLDEGRWARYRPSELKRLNSLPPLPRIPR